jgi:Na+/H+-dicarboxylate symporter/ABC-type amino acid transport substrate-binding protein
MPFPVSKLIPKTLGGKCIASVFVGILMGFLLGEKAAVLEPIGIIFIRATTLLVMPYLIVELIGVFGGLKREAMIALLKNGGPGIALIFVIGAAVVTLTPSFLPPLPSSPLFNRDLLEPHASSSLLDLFLPANIFSALASGNFPAIVIMSSAIGIVLQTMKGREAVLALIEPLRNLFSTILNIVISHVTPFGILAITAHAVGSTESTDFQRLLGLVAMYVVSISVVVLVVLPGVLLTFTRFGYRELWQVVRDPLVLALSAGSVLITLPVVIANMRVVLAPKTSEEQENLAPVEALIPLGMTLFSLGKITTPIFVPFAAWYFDAPMSISRILAMLPSAIPTAMGRSSIAVIEEIPKAGLPSSLVSLFYMNEQWTSRCSDIFTLPAVATMAFLLHSFLTKSIRFRPVPMVSFAALAGLLAVSMGFGANKFLASALSGLSHAHEIVMTRTSMVPETSATILSTTQLPQPDTSSLARVKERGVLRAGIRSDSPPYVYRNSHGELVGHDIDLLKSLSFSLGVKLELIEGSYQELLEWLSETRVDCAAGGLLATGIRPNGFFSLVTYAHASYAVVVPDTKVAEFQDRLDGGSSVPLKFAMAPPESNSSDLRRTISDRYSRPNRQRVVFQSISTAGDFASGTGRADALLTTAEAGSAYAVIHPQFTMLPIFGKSLTADVVLLFEVKDRSLPDFVKNWILENNNLDLIERLENHWILYKSTRKPD